MPDWQPNWSDVEFDHAAATEAARECRTAARTIDQALTGLAGLPAADHWTGRYKDEWEDDQVPTADDLRGTADDLRALARAIDAAAEDARLEQQARERERERWRDELEAEQADAPPGPGGSGGGRVPVAQ